MVTNHLVIKGQCQHIAGAPDRIRTDTTFEVEGFSYYSMLP